MHYQIWQNIHLASRKLMKFRGWVDPTTFEWLKTQVAKGYVEEGIKTLSLVKVNEDPNLPSETVEEIVISK